MDTGAVMEAHVCELWTRALQEAYSLAKGQRLNELEGRYVRRFDDSGLHPYSEVCGRVFACEDLVPTLSLAHFSPEALRKVAVEDANEAFRERVKLGLIVAGEVVAPPEAA